MTSVEMTEQQELAVENQRLTAAQQAIAEIQQRRNARQRASDIALLEKVRGELQAQTNFYEKHLPRFRARQQDHENSRSHVVSARMAVADSTRAQPSIATYLPHDHEVVRWRQRHEGLVARLHEVEAEFARLEDPEHLRVKLSQAAQQIQTLTYSANNLQRKLEGFTGKSWLEGGSGVSNVSGGNPPNGKAWVR